MNFMNDKEKLLIGLLVLTVIAFSTIFVLLRLDLRDARIGVEEVNLKLNDCRYERLEKGKL